MFLLLLLLLALAVFPGGSSRKAAAGGSPSASVPGGVTLPDSVLASEPASSRKLTHGNLARRAAVWRPVVARRRPNSFARPVARLSTLTPEGTDEIVLALREKIDDRGQAWALVRLPILPNNSTGWVPSQALGPYTVLRTRLVVDTTRFTASLFRGGEMVFRARIGVGKTKWPTPQGNFYVRNKLINFQSPFYGPIAFGTSARSAVLTDWPGGGFVGIHGTNRPDLIPGRISHGCIRMRNADVLRLARLMQPGTPLTIR